MDPKLADYLAKGTADDYDTLAEDMDRTRRAVWADVAECLPSWEPGSRIIDVGCGNGRMVPAVPEGAAYIGLDASGALVAKGKEHYASRKTCSFLVGDACNLPFPDASFDSALMIAVLHQIPGEEKRRRALREIYRVLKPGGELTVSVWNLFRPKYLGRLVHATGEKLLGQHGMDWGDCLIPWKGTGVQRYYHAFTQRSFRAALVESGFRIVKFSAGRNYIALVQKPLG